MDLENLNFKVITNEGAKCGFCNKILKPKGLDYLYANVSKDYIEYERCNCKDAINFWKEYDLKLYKDEQQKKYKETINKIYNDNFLKKRLQKYNFENIDFLNIETIKIIENYTKECIKGKMKDGIIIYGNFGYENTYIAACIANKMIENDKIILMEKSSSILDRIKESFNKNTISELELIELYSNIDMLIIDDFASEIFSKWAVDELYKIINNRYENELPIVITTRYTKEELISKISSETDLKDAKDLVQILYKMCYGVSIANSDFDNKNQVEKV